MPLEKKLLPRPSFSLVLHPEGNRDYKHFEGAAEVPFENGASTMSRANAWWLADSSLLASWDQAEARKRFADAAGLDSGLIEGKRIRSATSPGTTPSRRGVSRHSGRQVAGSHYRCDGPVGRLGSAAWRARPFGIPRSAGGRVAGDCEGRRAEETKGLVHRPQPRSRSGNVGG